jgi:hypothetical protein
MAVGENIRLNHHLVIDNALNREKTAINLGPYGFDDDTPPAFCALAHNLLISSLAENSLPGFAGRICGLTLY